MAEQRNPNVSFEVATDKDVAVPVSVNVQAGNNRIPAARFVYHFW